MNNAPRQSRRRTSTSWKIYLALALIVTAGLAMLLGFNSDLFKPATGAANAMALSSDR